MADEERKDKIEPVWVEKTIINPAQDFKDFNGSKIAFFTVPVPCRTTNSKGIEDEAVKPMCMQSNKCYFFLTDDELTQRDYLIRGKPQGIERRWSLESIKKFKSAESGEKIDPKALFDRIKKEIQAYIDFRDSRYYDFLALWTMGTYLHRLFRSFPYVFLNALKRCGKTKLLTLEYCLSFNPVFSTSITGSSVFRHIQDNSCTLLMDETDDLRFKENQDNVILPILFSGYKKSGAKAHRTGGKDGDYAVSSFDVYSPKMFANIKGIDNILADRCITVILERTTNTQIGDKEIEESEPKWQEIRDQLYLFAMQNFKEIWDTYESLDRFSVVSVVSVVSEDHNGVGLSNREWELWKPLISIARLMGGEVEKNLVSLALHTARQKDMDEIGDNWEQCLVIGLYKLIKSEGWFSVKEITNEARYELDEAPEGLNTRWVGRALMRLNIREKRRVGNGVQYKIAPSQVMDIANRLHIPLSTTTLNYTTTLTTQETNKELNNGGNLGSEVSGEVTNKLHLEESTIIG